MLETASYLAADVCWVLGHRIGAGILLSGQIEVGNLAVPLVENPELFAFQLDPNGTRVVSVPVDGSVKDLGWAVWLRDDRREVLFRTGAVPAATPEP